MHHRWNSEIDTNISTNNNNLSKLFNKTKSSHRPQKTIISISAINIAENQYFNKDTFRIFQNSFGLFKNKSRQLNEKLKKIYIDKGSSCYKSLDMPNKEKLKINKKMNRLISKNNKTMDLIKTINKKKTIKNKIKNKNTTKKPQQYFKKVAKKATKKFEEKNSLKIETDYLKLENNMLISYSPIAANKNNFFCSYMSEKETEYKYSSGNINNKHKKYFKSNMNTEKNEETTNDNINYYYGTENKINKHKTHREFNKISPKDAILKISLNYKKKFFDNKNFNDSNILLLNNENINNYTDINKEKKKMDNIHKHRTIIENDSIKTIMEKIKLEKISMKQAEIKSREDLNDIKQKLNMKKQ